MDSLVPAYRKMADANFNGLSILNHVASIKAMIDATESRSMLDFGCGRGDAYRDPHNIHHELGIHFTRLHLYDPAFPHIGALPPTKMDIVVCSDVLEHIPEPEVDAFIVRLFKYANRAVWASVCCRPAKKVFPGTDINLHVTVQPLEWWDTRFVANRVGSVIWHLEQTP